MMAIVMMRLMRLITMMMMMMLLLLFLVMLGMAAWVVGLEESNRARFPQSLSNPPDAPR